ncbi:MAG: hypothetical protein LBU70_01600 [Chitinispirillales bacterium]|nr:hypothetical protein [Chitinispirillales bacterium]
MITEVAEKRYMTLRDVDYDFDGRWVLLCDGDSPASTRDMCLVAYGDGTSMDREALRKINFDRYDGHALVTKGYLPKDEVYNCGIITGV